MTTAEPATTLEVASNPIPSWLQPESSTTETAHPDIASPSVEVTLPSEPVVSVETKTETTTHTIEEHTVFPDASLSTTDQVPSWLVDAPSQSTETEIPPIEVSGTQTPEEISPQKEKKIIPPPSSETLPSWLTSSVENAEPIPPKETVTKTEVVEKKVIKTKTTTNTPSPKEEKNVKPEANSQDLPSWLK